MQRIHNFLNNKKNALNGDGLMFSIISMVMHHLQSDNIFTLSEIALSLSISDVDDIFVFNIK